MDIYVCNGKEKQGNITNYLLTNIRNNRQEIVDGDKLKKAMHSKRVDVMNLTLTSDNRLVEASKDKIVQLGSILKAPAEIRDKLTPLAPIMLDHMNELIDEIIKDCIQEYIKDYSRYVKIKSIDKDNNTFVLEFTLGLNSYVLCQYDKIIYGKIEDEAYLNDKWACDKPSRSATCGICFDIGIQIVGISNKRASSKIGDGRIMKASALYNTKYIVVDLMDNQDHTIDHRDLDIKYLKSNLGRILLSYIGTELNTVCENNPDIANNTNLNDYIRYDKYKNEYIKMVGIDAALNLGGAVALGSLVAVLLITNPEIIQQGLLGDLMKTGTASEILRATWACSGGISLAAGGIGMGIMNKQEDFGYLTRTAKADYEKIKRQIEKDKVPLVGKRKM